MPPEEDDIFDGYSIIITSTSRRDVSQLIEAKREFIKSQEEIHNFNNLVEKGKELKLYDSELKGYCDEQNKKH